MKDLIAKLQSDACVAMGAIWLHIEAREARITELESENAKLRSAQVVAESVAPTPEFVAYAEDGVLHWLTGRKFQDCKLYTAPLPASADKLREAILALQYTDSAKYEHEYAGQLTGYANGFADARLESANIAVFMALQAPVLSDEQIDAIWRERYDASKEDWDADDFRMFARNILAATTLHKE